MTILGFGGGVAVELLTTASSVFTCWASCAPKLLRDGERPAGELPAGDDLASRSRTRCTRARARTSRCRGRPWRSGPYPCRRRSSGSLPPGVSFSSCSRRRPGTGANEPAAPAPPSLVRKLRRDAGSRASSSIALIVLRRSLGSRTAGKLAPPRRRKGRRRLAAPAPRSLTVRREIPVNPFRPRVPHCGRLA